MQDDEQRRRERLERLIADFQGRLDAFVDDLETASQGAEGARYARVADHAKALAAELAAPGGSVDAADQTRGLILEALGEAHQPLRESVLYERVLGRGAPVSPEEFVALASDLATLGLVRVTVEHDLPSHDAPPFQPRFYRPAA